MAQSDVAPQLCRTHINPSQTEERQGQKQMHNKTRTTKLPLTALDIAGNYNFKASDTLFGADYICSYALA